jgi:hypothetical protein
MAKGYQLIPAYQNQPIPVRGSNHPPALSSQRNQNKSATAGGVSAQSVESVKSAVYLCVATVTRLHF